MYMGLFLFFLALAAGYRNTLSLKQDSTPIIDDIVANNTRQELCVKWRINLDDDVESNITFIIQFARGKNLSKVNETIVHFDRNIGDGIFQWKWISEWPLQCTDHSVRIKRLSNSFASNWSEWKTNSGVPAPDDKPEIFPFEQVLQEGSSGHFCCIVPRGRKIKGFTFKHIPRPHSLIDEGVYGIIVNNLNHTTEFGVLATCEDSNAQKTRTLNCVSSPPLKPRNIQCETDDMEYVNCSWDPDTRLTLKNFIYHCILTLQNSIKVIPGVYNHCSFQAMPDQKVYNITVKATNSLGEESESLSFLITDIVSPKVKFVAVVPATRHANVSFFVKGNFSRFNLTCQVETSDGNQTMKETLKGLTSSWYQVTMGGLQPLEQYTFQVRCSLAGSARGFGPWISSQRFTTHTEPPSVSLDLWRTVHEYSGTRNVTLMWKIIYNNNSKTNISKYEVQFGNSKQIVTGQDMNHTSINISLGTCSIAVRAVNEAGSSLPSYIVIPTFRNNSVTNSVKTPKAKRVNGHPVQGIRLSWEACDWVTCGYTVDWSKATEPNQVLNWVKVHGGSTYLILSAEWFKPGCRYTFRVFGCHGYEHVLVEEITGYAEELEPRRKPTLNPVSISSSSALLSWEFNEDDPADPGFITGYRVTVHVTDSLQLVFREELNDLHIKNVVVNNLQDGTKYTFQVQAYTKAGFGPPDETTATSPSNHARFLVQLVIPLLLLLSVGVFISFYSQRIKAYVEPFFFTPVKLTARKLEINSSLYEVSEKIKALKVEDCPCSSIDVLEESSMEKHQMLDIKTQGSQLPYRPQSPSNSLCDHVNSGISGITNMTYLSTSELQQNPYIVMLADSPAGPPGYVTTTDKLY